jgi:hypothetical protein
MIIFLRHSLLKFDYLFMELITDITDIDRKSLIGQFIIVIEAIPNFHSFFLDNTNTFVNSFNNSTIQENPWCTIQRTLFHR